MFGRATTEGGAQSSVARRQALQVVLALGAVCLASLLFGAHAAHADVFWESVESELGEPTHSSIGRANTDGSEANPGFIPTGEIHDRSLASDGKYIYGSGSAEEEISGIARAKLDGEEQNSHFIAGIERVRGIAVSGGYIYWASVPDYIEDPEAPGEIGRAKLNGEEVIDDFIEVGEDPEGLAISGEYIYWSGDEEIGRAKLSGANPEVLAIGEVGDTRGLAVSGQQLYWTHNTYVPEKEGIEGHYEGAIGSATIGAGGEVLTSETELIGGLEQVTGIAVDSKHLYWGNREEGTIGRAQLNGGDEEDDFISGAGEPEGVLATERKATVSPSCQQTATANIFNCTVTVSDASGEPRLVALGGEVSLGVTLGNFEPLSGRCALKPTTTTGSASCALVYKGPKEGVSPAGPTITAVYEGDGEFAPATGTSTLCVPTATSAVPARPGPFGAHPHTAVTLAGSGFCTGDLVIFGNEKALVAMTHEDIVNGGASVTVKIPRLATTGKITVLALGGEAAVPGPFAIDSFRNTEGFQFLNYKHKTSYGELIEAFGEEQTLESVTINACPPGSCPTKVLRPNPTLLFLDEHRFNKTLEAGLCFGFALASLQFESGRASLASFDANAQDAFQLGSTTGPGAALESFLATRALLQFSDQYIDAEAATDRTGAGFIASIQAVLESGTGALVTMVKTNKDAKGNTTTTEGHAVIATGVEELTQEPGTYLVETVDSNDPYLPGEYAEESSDGAVHAPRATYLLVKGNTWSYPDLKWQGPTSEIVAVSPSVFNGALTLETLRGKSKKQTDASIEPGVELVALQNGEGQTLSPGEAGISPDPPISAAGPVPDASFTAPLGAYTDTLSSSGSPVAESWSGGGGLVAAEGSAKTATIGFEPKSLQVEYAPKGAGGSHPSKLTLISEPAKGTVRSAEVEVSNPLAGVTAAMGASRDELKLTSTATTKLSIAIEQSTGPDALVQERIPRFTLKAGSTATVIPASWHGKAGAGVSVELAPKHGRARKLRLKTRVHESKSPLKVTHLAQHRSGKRVKLSMELDTPKLPSGSTEAVTAIVKLGHKRPHSYRLLPSRIATAGKRRLSLGIATHGKTAKVKIVLVSVSGKTGALSTRTATLDTKR